jgi:hypothetical protein
MSDLGLLLILLIVGEIIIMLPFLIFMRLGGYPVGLWRILRIKFFFFWLIDPDNTLNKIPYRWNHIQTHSPSYFDYKGKRFYIDKQNTMRSLGRPAWMYFPDNAFPVPVLTAERTRLLDPEKVKKAFNNEMLKQWYRIRNPEQKGFQIGRIVIYGVIALVALFVLLSLHVI